MEWYLARYKAGKHNAFKLQMFLAKLDVDVFIPQSCYYRAREDRPGHFRPVIEALFPGYIFLYFDPEVTHTSKIASCPGFGCFVRFGGLIKPINSYIVDEIMKLVITPSLKMTAGLASETEKNKFISSSQREVIKKIIEENNKDVRSALLYEYIETIRG